MYVQIKYYLSGRGGGGWREQPMGAEFFAAGKVTKSGPELHQDFVILRARIGYVPFPCGTQDNIGEI